MKNRITKKKFFKSTLELTLLSLIKYLELIYFNGLYEYK